MTQPAVTAVEPVRLYEILVPTMRRKDDKPIKLRYHRVWDAKVRDISGGLTVMPPAKGQWLCNEGNLFAERMIPVRFIATPEQANRIIDMTMLYYDQLAIMCYVVSTEVILRYRDDA
jgi:hypothetical protein